MRARPVPPPRPGVAAGLLGLRPKRTASRGFAPLRIRPVPHTRPGVAAGLLGRWPKRTASRGFAPCCYAPCRIRGPGFRPAYWACGPNARPPGALPPCAYAPCRIRGPGLRPAYWADGPNARPPGASPPTATPRAAYAARGCGRLIGPMAQTHGLQGLCPLRLRPVPPAVRSAYNKGPGFREKSGALAAPARQSNWTERSALPVMAFWRHLPRRKK